MIVKIVTFSGEKRFQCGNCFVMFKLDYDLLEEHRCLANYNKPTIISCKGKCRCRVNHEELNEKIMRENEINAANRNYLADAYDHPTDKEFCHGVFRDGTKKLVSIDEINNKYLNDITIRTKKRILKNFSISIRCDKCKKSADINHICTDFKDELLELKKIVFKPEDYLDVTINTTDKVLEEGKIITNNKTTNKVVNTTNDNKLVNTDNDNKLVNTDNNKLVNTDNDNKLVNTDNNKNTDKVEESEIIVNNDYNKLVKTNKDGENPIVIHEGNSESEKITALAAAIIRSKKYVTAEDKFKLLEKLPIEQSLLPAQKKSVKISRQFNRSLHVDLNSNNSRVSDYYLTTDSIDTVRPKINEDKLHQLLELKNKLCMELTEIEKTNDKDKIIIMYNKLNYINSEINTEQSRIMIDYIKNPPKVLSGDELNEIYRDYNCFQGNDTDDIAIKYTIDERNKKMLEGISLENKSLEIVYPNSRSLESNNLDSRSLESNNY